MGLFIKKKSLLKFFLIFLSSNIFGQTFTKFDTNYRYYYGNVSMHEDRYFSFYVPANEIGVLTLKTRSATSDFDLYAYFSNDMSNLVDKSNSSGTETELIILPVLNYGRYVYIRINNSGRYGEYYFYAHNVDIRGKFGEALILAILEGILTSGEDVNDRNLSRGLIIANSILRNHNLEDVSRSFLLNEITSELRKELGYGAVAGFFVNFTVSVFDDILKNIW